MELTGKYVPEMFTLYEDCIGAMMLSMETLVKRRNDILERAEKDSGASGIILPPTL